MIELKEYKGHIRNWQNLCAELQIDTEQEAKNREREIIVKGYERWGEEVVNHLIGMFSFAIVDGNKTYCARDHFGTKPLYYFLILSLMRINSRSSLTVFLMPIIL